jgi:signal transduction histidine kinase/CheY-like chemotaxis protein
MLSSFYRKRVSGARQLREKLSLIETLVFGLPFVSILYLGHQGHISLDGGQIVFLAFLLLVVLAGLVMLRQFFDRFLEFTSVVRKAAAGQIELMDAVRQTGDLAEVAGAFSSFFDKLESTNEDLARKVQSLSVMRELLHLTNHTDDFDILLKSLLDKAMILAEAEIGSVFATDPESGWLRLVHYKAPVEGQIREFPIRADSPFMRRAMADKKPFLVRDIETDLRTLRPSAPRYGSPSFLVIPIFAGKEVAGILNLARKRTRKAFNEEDEHLLSIVVGEMGFALQNSYLTKKCNEQASLLEKTTEALQTETEGRKHAEEERRKLASHMVHAQKMQAIGTLAGGVAHDFNNLLMAIQGNVSMMLLDTGSEYGHFHRLKNIEKQVASGSRLTRQLLGLAREGQGDWRAVQLNKLVRETSETFGRTRKDVSIHLDLAEDLAPVEGDAAHLEQVLWNLYINASDAMPKGGKILIQTRNIPPEAMRAEPLNPNPAPHVTVSVQDTGCGMDPETIRQIFEPFFTTKESGKGTGLGLASVNGIVKAHGGCIDVQSQKGRGSVFHLYFPATLKEAAKAMPEDGAPVRGTGRVLLVDDEESVRGIGKEMLGSLGYEVVEAATGSEALCVFKERHKEIDVVILDLVMPEMRGEEIFARLMAIHPKARILLSSGFDKNEKAAELLEQGGLAFIQKPFTLTYLSQVLERIFTGKEKGAA